MTINLFRTLVYLLLVLNSSGALIAGWSFMRDPSGTGVGITVEWLKHSPFYDYFVPGLILFLVNGVYGVLVFICIYMHHHRYPSLITLQGVLLGGWIVVQMILLRTINFLQTTCFFMAVAFILLGILLKNMEAKSSHRSSLRKLRTPKGRLV